MSKVNSIRNIDVSTASFPITLLLLSPVTQYKIYGAKALSADVVITNSGTEKEGMAVGIDWNPTVTTTTALSRYGDYKFSIFGTKIPYSWLSKKLKIWCEYHNSAWEVFVLPSIDSLPSFDLEMINPAIFDDSTIGADSTTGIFEVKTGGIGATQLATDAVETAKIKAKAVELAKIQDITRGSLLSGGAANAPTLLSAKLAGQILIGDGTDIASVASSGDVTVGATGVFAIGAAKVLSAMIKAGELVTGHLSAAAGILFTQMGALTVSKIPQINGSGFIEASAVATSKLTFLNVAAAGTLENSKAVVVSAAGKIDTLDITAPKINGTAVTATAAELNFSAGVTSDVQTQLDAAASGNTTYSMLTGTQALTYAVMKANHVINSATPTVITLPAANTCDANQTVEFMRTGIAAASVAPAGADLLYDTDSVDQASLALAASGDGVTLYCNGTNAWRTIRWNVA